MDLHLTSLWNRGLRQLRNIIANSLVPLAAPSVLSFSPDLCRRWRSFEPYPNKHDLVKQARETKRKYSSATHQSLPFKEFHDPWHFRGNFSHRKKPNKSSEKWKKKNNGGKEAKASGRREGRGGSVTFLTPKRNLSSALVNQTLEAHIHQQQQKAAYKQLLGQSWFFLVKMIGTKKRLNSFKTCFPPKF